MSFQIDPLDHLVLTDADIDVTLEFYQRVLGMKAANFGPGRKALFFGQQKLNLHQKGQEFETKALHPTTGAIDLCLITYTPLEDVMEHLKREKVLTSRDWSPGPDRRTIRSVYFRDPGQNLIEVANY